MCACIHPSIRPSIRLHSPTHPHTYIYTHIYTPTQIHTPTHIHIHIYMHTHNKPHTYIHTRTHIHTDTHSKVLYTVGSIGYTPRYTTQQRIHAYTRRTRSVQRGRFRSLETGRHCHYSISDGALFIILIKTTIFYAQDFDHELNLITCNIDN